MATQEQIDQVKGLYAIICNHQGGDGPDAVQVRVNVIRELEKITNTRFSNTKHFHQKVGEYMSGGLR
jgi:hypothetical protein